MSSSKGMVLNGLMLFLMNKAQLIYPDSEESFWQMAKMEVLLILQEVIKNQKDCRLGLAGGSTPKTLYALLAQEPLPWEKIKIILIDERAVPSDHPESNLRMLRESLLNHISLPPENLLAFDTSLPQESAAEEMSRKLTRLANERQPLFDLLILGAGADGHIASLFEGDAALESRDYASLALAPAHPISERLTLTLVALENSARALLLLKGPEKLAIAQTLEGGSDALPLSALRHLLKNMPLKVLAFLRYK